MKEAVLQGSFFISLAIQLLKHKVVVQQVCRTTTFSYPESNVVIYRWRDYFLKLRIIG